MMIIINLFLNGFLTINSNLISLTKIHAYSDDIDERAKLSKQTLPEFLFDYYLNVFGEPQLAEEALVIIVANVRTYDTTSPRAWMFSRFLRFLCVCACVPACVRACVSLCGILGRWRLQCLF